MAREDGVQVLLAGDGGDEIFGGNVRYAKQKVFEAYGHIPSALRRGLIEPLAFAPGSGHLPPLRKLASYIRQASMPLPDRLESYNFLHRSPLAEVFELDFLAAISQEEPIDLLRDVYGRTTSVSPVNRMMHLDLKFTLADNDLRKVSRMCDMAGIEVRYPLLDDELVEFSGEIPASLKVKGLKLRHFFKQAMKDVLPPETIAKSKHGFGMPFGLWLRDHPPLADLVPGSLADFGRRGILRPSYLQELRRQHLTGHATYFGIMIWVIAMLERWLADAPDSCCRRSSVRIVGRRCFSTPSNSSSASSRSWCWSSSASRAGTTKPPPRGSSWPRCSSTAGGTGPTCRCSSRRLRSTTLQARIASSSAREVASRAALLALAVGANLLLLGYYKYANFFLDVWGSLTGMPSAWAKSSCRSASRSSRSRRSRSWSTAIAATPRSTTRSTTRCSSPTSRT